MRLTIKTFIYLLVIISFILVTLMFDSGGGGIVGRNLMSVTLRGHPLIKLVQKAESRKQDFRGLPL